MKTDERDRQIRNLKRLVGAYQPLEINQLRAAFPSLDQFIAELWDLYEASDPARSKEIGAGGRGNPDLNGRSQDGRSLQGGPQTHSARDRMFEVDRKIRRLAEGVFDGVDRPPRSARLLNQSRVCVNDGCADYQHRQYGMAHRGAYVCRSCREPLKERQ